MTNSKVVALTGRPGVGKTTAMMRVVDFMRRDGHTVVGFYSREVREKGVRLGFEMVDIVSGQALELAWVREGKGSRVGKYLVNIDNVDKMSRELAVKVSQNCEAVFLDEVGPMELLSKVFVEAVEEILRVGKPSLFTVHYSARHPLVNEVKEKAGSNLFTIDYSNRDRVPFIVYSVMKQWLKS